MFFGFSLYLFIYISFLYIIGSFFYDFGFERGQNSNGVTFFSRNSSPYGEGRVDLASFDRAYESHAH